MRRNLYAVVAACCLFFSATATAQQGKIAVPKKAKPAAAAQQKANSSSGTQKKKTAQGQNYTETAFGINMRMVYVEGGTFTMGCTGDQGDDCDDDEKPGRQTTVSPFYIGMLEVTQSQWEKVMGTTIYQQRDKADPEWSMNGNGPDYPMYYVSWEEAKEFCARLSRATGRTYSLPTEAEWEYAARGGRRNEGTKYAGGWMVDNVAWYDGNSGGMTHPCGTKRANALGLYDMSGNVWEWCEDWYDNAYPQYDNNNPKGPNTGSRRVLRGGSWTTPRGGLPRCGPERQLSRQPGQQQRLPRSGSLVFLRRNPSGHTKLQTEISV